MLTLQIKYNNYSKRDKLVLEINLIKLKFLIKNFNTAFPFPPNRHHEKNTFTRTTRQNLQNY